MTDESPSVIGTVAQEAARLIEDMATMAHSGYSGHAETGSDEDYEGWESEADDPAAESEGFEVPDEPSSAACSMCGAEPVQDSARETPSACRICPLCRGIDLLRSVRPETVDMLADLAMSVAASLREVAMRSRTSEQRRSESSTSKEPREADRAPVQDIPVNDESEG
ncbi:MAG: hypothetical protein QOF35_327 [Actinomycetota bacterium]|nr:hypothetical protein [Actinomycetota bacterium]